MNRYRIDIGRVRELAFKQGMTLSGLCKKAGIDRSRATAWKSCGVYPSTVYRIAQVLEADPMDLIVKEE